MATQYAGDPDSFPESFEIPDDSDDADAASANVGFEALADRTAYLQKTLQVAGIDREEFIKVVTLPAYVEDDLDLLIDSTLPTEMLELPLGELRHGDVVMYEVVVRAGSLNGQGGWVGVARDSWQTVIAVEPARQASEVAEHQVVIAGRYVEASSTPVTRKLVLVGMHNDVAGGGALSVYGRAVMRATIYRTNAQEP